MSRLVPCNMRCVLISHIEIRLRLVPGGKVYVEVHFMILALWETLNQNVREGERVGGFMCLLTLSLSILLLPRRGYLFQKNKKSMLFC